jgi:hypothetical protein
MKRTKTFHCELFGLDCGKLQPIPKRPSFPTTLPMSSPWSYKSFELGRGSLYNISEHDREYKSTVEQLTLNPSALDDIIRSDCPRDPHKEIVIPVNDIEREDFDKAAHAMKILNVLPEPTDQDYSIGAPIFDDERDQDRDSSCSRTYHFSRRRLVICTKWACEHMVPLDTVLLASIGNQSNYPSAVFSIDSDALNVPELLHSKRKSATL